MLQNHSEPSTWRLWGLYLRSQQATGPHNIKPMIDDYSPLPTDQESYDELQELCLNCGVVLGGAETITELIEILEPLIGDIY